MKAIIRFSVLLLLFWLIVFLIGRLCFYLCVIPLLKNVSPNLIFQSFFRGIRLDLSMAVYFLLLPFILSTFYYFLRKKIFVRIVDWLNYFFITFYTLTLVGEACLYREWKSKLNMQALSHFENPSEVFKTSSWGLIFLFFGLSAVLLFLFVLVYRKRVAMKIALPEQLVSLRERLWKGSLYFVLAFVISAFCIRGGLQVVPIQESDAYFCNVPIANDVAVNPGWNILRNFIEYQNLQKVNPFKDFSQPEAERIVQEMFEVKADSTVLILSNTRPNIVFIILESFSGKLSKKLGGDNYTPFLDSLAGEGIVFTNFYPQAYTSDQGVPAILSAYPSVSRIAIINHPTKSQKLNCINKDLKNYGYSSGFFYGGDLNFGNLKGYFYNMQFDLIVEERDIDDNFERGTLGIQDGIMQQVFLNYLNEAKEPFNYYWFTLSSHMPYDFPGERQKLVDHPENDFVNSVVYADQALRTFFHNAEKQTWYKNTLFVLVADHSHATHLGENPYEAEYQRIPLVFFGEVIVPEWRGRSIEAVFGQTDIAAGLLMQLGLSEEAGNYRFSRNLFNPTIPHFAYFCCFEGGGMVCDSGSAGYNHRIKDLLYESIGKESLLDSIIRLSKAYQQVVYEDYRLK